MRYKNLLLSLVFFIAKPAFAWLHINELKPHLAVSPEHPTVTFYWNGDSPELDEKDAVLDGKFSEASDAELMEALLKAAMDKWNDVETAYINMVVQQNASVEINPDDETFSIVVADQVSKAVAASAQPSFLTQDPNPSDLEKNPHIIHDCDISVSTAKVSAQSLLRTLVHELGHCL
ncbi:MAG: hypothetical protein NTX25_13890, partial [Proteobacteria bacterium]|nr:hypothetical protein [Pseudomonadota bacterium]